MSYTPTGQSQTKDQVVLFTRGVTTQYGLDKYANSNTCECIAIKKAIQTCIDRPQNNVMCTDSKSCLISLKNTFAQDPLILDTQDKTHTATRARAQRYSGQRRSRKGRQASSKVGTHSRTAQPCRRESVPKGHGLVVMAG